MAKREFTITQRPPPPPLVALGSMATALQTSLQSPGGGSGSRQRHANKRAELLLLSAGLFIFFGVHNYLQERIMAMPGWKYGSLHDPPIISSVFPLYAIGWNTLPIPDVVYPASRKACGSVFHSAAPGASLNCVWRSHTRVVSGRRPVKNDERVGQQIASWTYARSKSTAPFECARASMFGVNASPP